MTDVASLQHMSRNELVEEARQQGIERPERLTRIELRTELSRRLSAGDDQHDTRGLWGVARSMLASVVEAGLKLPDAASKIRGDATIDVPVRNQSPVATVTLAEIYAAQGHRTRALSMLHEVLEQEPDHVEAARILAELSRESAGGAGSEAAGQSVSDEAPTDDTSAEDAPAGDAPAGDVPAGDVPAGDAPAGDALGLDGSSGDLGKRALGRTGGDSVSSEPLDLTEERGESSDRSSGPTTEYVPNVFFDTSGEDVATGEPPSVQAAEPSPSPASETPASVGADPESSEQEEFVALIFDRRGEDLLLYAEVTTELVRARGIDWEVGEFVIEVVSFSPSRTHPERRVEHVRLGFSVPTFRRLSGFGSRDAVRAALGWSSPAGFVPLAVGRSLDELGRPQSGTLAARAERAMGP